MVSGVAGSNHTGGEGADHSSGFAVDQYDHFVIAVGAAKVDHPRRLAGAWRKCFYQRTYQNGFAVCRGIGCCGYTRKGISRVYGYGCIPGGCKPGSISVIGSGNSPRYQGGGDQVCCTCTIQRYGIIQAGAGKGYCAGRCPGIRSNDCYVS
ncbi:hypothetical protein D3C81_1627820 [compost metagenome]